MSDLRSTSAVLWKPVDVPQSLQDGEKFVKWDEDSGVGTLVTLRVDAHGFYLHWVDQNKEMEILDIATIRDSRTGRFAKIPKDQKLKQIVSMGCSQDTLEEKTVTICYGSDFVNLAFVNFCCKKKEIAQLWTEEILKLAYNLSQSNCSASMLLCKAHTKLCLATDKTGKIPVKNITKMFAQNKEDRRRVEKALDSSGLPSGKNEVLNPPKFQFEEFFNFYKNLTQRTEVEKVFEELCGTSKRRLMTAAQLVDFLNKTQRDPRLNEILYPYANTTRAKDLIQQYEPNKYNAQKGQLSFDGFLHYLMSEDNPVMSPSMSELSHDMDQPLPHYFINSSHNTYLTGHQITGKSAVEMYRQCLLAGCRCVELDFWNGRTEEPIIVHGYTFVPEISAKDVIEAIAETAFKTSDFPVILSFENHCNPRQQAKIAQYCREIFGDMLLNIPLETHKLEPGSPLPPPSLLKRKIIIKNKKKHHHHGSKSVSSGNSSSQSSLQQEGGEAAQGNGDVPRSRPPSRESARHDDDDEDEDSSSGEEPEEDVTDVTDVTKQDKAAADKVVKETEAGAEISALVNYVQPVHFNSFENSEKKNRYYEMSSFDEKQATQLLKEQPIEFVNYNKHQLSRVYPGGTRFDSSNFMPQVFWNAGCQLVALNYQTLDLAMMLNLGIFEYNLRSGYLLKPEFMRRKDRRLDPFAESTVDGIIAGSVTVQVISGQFLTDKRVGTYVEVDMYGLPADTVRRRFRTRIVPGNAINPVFNEDPFVFKKVVLPELASLRVAAYEESGRLIGHRVLPVVGLCPGYRHVVLKTESGQPLPLATLFVLIVVKDYVPDDLSVLAEALANPIKYQSELEKRAQQLAVFTDDVDVECNKVQPPPAAGVKKVSVPDLPPASQASVSPGQRTARSASTDPEPGAEQDPGGTAPVSQPPAGKQAPGTVVPAVSEDLVAEPLERFLESKTVKEKRLELEKKLESLRKKHLKERSAFAEPDKCRSKFYIGQIRRRKRSSNQLEVGPMVAAPADDSASESVEGEAPPARPGLPRSQSGRLLAACKEHVLQEKELQEKYHDMIFSSVEKLMKLSQSSQLKTLQAELHREKEDMMRRLQAMRRDEIKTRSKVHRDRDEMVRIKREVDSAMVEKGVHERVRLTEMYDRRRYDLERQHNEVQQALEEVRKEAWAALAREYEGRYARVEEDLQGVASDVPVTQ
ncbi:1-phosphatidylinositol 4,5-bisphosphate phosphodiesterase classes I and II [Bacillus rossius redtenbacheri]|uniref:1-phosphatidylinositol 4,5-bisphosphate phosphodiesterase classes I and II n=1 Tax=Bacillus rossius redtenbacheri TaxID=93214 RepID=UPI002FDDA257